MDSVEERTALTQSVVDTVAVKPTDVPTPHPKTGLVHCVLERTAHRGLSLHKKNANISLRWESNNAVVLRAQAVKAHRFAIFSDDNDNEEPVATLARLQSNMASISYGLRDADGVLTTAIVYAVPTVSSFFKGPPPRRAQVALLKDPKEQHSDPHWFEAACRDSLQQQGNLDCLVGLPEVTLLTSKEPYQKPNGGVGLNFRGRGRRASPKNLQLAESSLGAVVAQMVKWDDNQYHLDFTLPLDPTAALALGLAQLDL